MAQLSLQQQIDLRRALRSDLINIEGSARAAILRKELVKDFINGKPCLSSMQLTALQNVVKTLLNDTKRLLSELDRQKTPPEPVLQSLKTFLSKHEISLDQFLNGDTGALHKIQAWREGTELFPAKLIPLIKRGLLQLSGDLA